MNDNEKPAAAGQPDQQPADASAAPQAQSAQEPATLDPVSALETRVKELETQQGDLTDRLLRAHAEMENLRKRTEREKADGAKYAISKFALDIVGISDNFQRAVAAVPPGAEADATLKSVVDGVVMTERAFLQVLERHGVSRIDPQGEPFDPNRHQAVMEQDSPELPAGTVMKVFQPGYMIDERVLRPAMVVVARGGTKPARPASATAEPPKEDNGGATGGDGTTA